MSDSNIVFDLLRNSSYSGFQYTGIYSLFFEKSMPDASRRFQIDFCLGICLNKNCYYFQSNNTAKEQQIVARLINLLGGDLINIWIDNEDNLFLGLTNYNNTEEILLVAPAKYDVSIYSNGLVDIAWEIREINYEGTYIQILITCDI